MKRQGFWVNFKRPKTPEYGDDYWPTPVKDEQANLTSSVVADTMIEGGFWPSHDAVMHAPALDIDVPARLVPSSTPGHSHLYIDVPMDWATYSNLLRALGAAGILETGYVEASIRQGATFLRPEGMTKEEAAAVPDPIEKILTREEAGPVF